MHRNKIKDEYQHLDSVARRFVGGFILRNIMGNNRMASDLLPGWKIFVNLR